MKSFIYLDNSATTKPCDESVKAITEALNNTWGNPSSLYDFGFKAELILDNARDLIADTLNCRSDEIFFTSTGTEANNLCIRGAADALKRRGNKIITTSVEHPSVLNTVNYLAENGFEVVKISPENDGNIDVNKVISAIDSNTVLISMMYVNNETGCIFPVKQVAEYIKEQKLPICLHSDCVQAFGKLPIDVEEPGANLISASGHKIHGPKGVGFIYKSKKTNIRPIVFGGNQEKGIRSGTESVPLIAGLLGAVKALDIKSSLKNTEDLKNYALLKLSAIPEIVVNSPLDGTLPYIINISVIGFRSETLLHFLESEGIYVSSGSACSKGNGSHVLTEMGLSADHTDSALRISFSRYSKHSDIDALCAALEKAVKTLKRK